MSNHRKFTADKEAILMALDQLSQTMEVMGQVVARLKRSVEQAEMSAQTTPQEFAALSHQASEMKADSQHRDISTPNKTESARQTDNLTKSLPSKRSTVLH